MSDLQKAMETLKNSINESHTRSFWAGENMLRALHERVGDKSFASMLKFPGVTTNTDGMRYIDSFIEDNPHLFLTHTQKRVLAILCRHWRFWNGNNSWKNFEKLSKRINRPLKETKEAVRDMADKGILEHGVMVNGDGIPAGSGYFLTPKYERYGS